jgi:hypothetical protein
MSKRPHRVLDPANFWLYSLYVVLLSLASAAALEVLKDFLRRIFGDNTLLSMTLTTTVCLVLCFIVWIAFRKEFRRRLGNSTINVLPIRPKRLVEASALITLCGPSAPERCTKNPAFEAAQYHRGTLKHLWLITSYSGEETAKWIHGQAESWGVIAHPPIVLADTCEIDIIRLKVEEARREAIEGYKIAEADIICDFTGMTKPVTAGMILACAPRGRRLQYLQGQYDANGKLMPDAPSIPIEIEIEYEIEPEL